MARASLSLEDVEAFVQVVDSRGFTAAGRVLGRTTKQVSRQVQRLEDGLGTPLLTRSTRAVAPTDAGRRFYPHARSLLDVADRAAHGGSSRSCRAGRSSRCRSTR